MNRLSFQIECCVYVDRVERDDVGSFLIQVQKFGDKFTGTVGAHGGCSQKAIPVLKDRRAGEIPVKSHHLFDIIVSLFFTALTSCGSGSQSSTSSSSTISSVAVTCAPSTIATTATSQCTATEAAPDFAVSSVLVAVTVKFPAEAGAVKSPLELMVPPVVDHFTVAL